MKGTKWNGDATITKGCGSSDREFLISVGNLIAYQVREYSSPDGRSYSHGRIPDRNYFLQEEIVLEEWDDSTFPGPGVGPVGSMNKKQIVEIDDLFFIEYSTQKVWKTFLVSVLETDQNVLGDSFSRDISEVRNHPGKFLHIYEIPKGYRKCKKENFADTVSAINLQKMQEEEAEKIIAGFESGNEVDADRLRDAYIKASQSVCDDWDFLFLAQKAGIEIAIEVAKANERSAMYALLSWKEAKITDEDVRNLESKIDSCYCTDYYVKRSGWEMGLYLAGEWSNNGRHFTLKNLKPDAIARHLALENEISLLRKERNKKKFKELSKTVLEKHGEEVFKIILRKKGSILKFLKMLSESSAQVKLQDLEKILQVTNNVSVIENLIVLVTEQVDTFKAAKVAEKGYAWAYLLNAFPGVEFKGYFDSARLALELYSKNWGPKVIESGGNTIIDLLEEKGINLTGE